MPFSFGESITSFCHIVYRADRLHALSLVSHPLLAAMLNVDRFSSRPVSSRNRERGRGGGTADIQLEDGTWAETCGLCEKRGRVSIYVASIDSENGHGYCTNTWCARSFLRKGQKHGRMPWTSASRNWQGHSEPPQLPPPPPPPPPPATAAAHMSVQQVPRSSAGSVEPSVLQQQLCMKQPPMEVQHMKVVSAQSPVRSIGVVQLVPSWTSENAEEIPQLEGGAKLKEEVEAAVEKQEHKEEAAPDHSEDAADLASKISKQDDRSVNANSDQEDVGTPQMKCREKKQKKHKDRRARRRKRSPSSSQTSSTPSVELRQCARQLRKRARVLEKRAESRAERRAEKRR